VARASESTCRRSIQRIGTRRGREANASGSAARSPFAIANTPSGCSMGRRPARCDRPSAEPDYTRVIEALRPSGRPAGLSLVAGRSRPCCRCGCLARPALRLPGSGAQLLPSPRPIDRGLASPAAPSCRCTGEPNPEHCSSTHPPQTDAWEVATPASPRSTSSPPAASGGRASSCTPQCHVHPHHLGLDGRLSWERPFAVAAMALEELARGCDLSPPGSLGHGSEFITSDLWAYFQRQEIQFPGPALQKDDNSHTRAENWTHVPQLLG